MPVPWTKGFRIIGIKGFNRSPLSSAEETGGTALAVPTSSATLARARLLAHPWVEVPSDLELPVRLSGSTAGPGAGSGAIFASFGGCPVRLNIADKADFRLEPAVTIGADQEAGGYRLLYQGQAFLDDIRLVEPLLHAPNMAFINLYSGCDYDCRFCSQPSNRQARVRSIQEIVGMVRQAKEKDRLDSIALTSGICVTPSTTNQALAWALAALRRTFPEIPVGVEPYIEDPADIETLLKAGAHEIKLNVQVATAELLKVHCPHLDWDLIWSNLEVAVELFGRGRVQSNLLIGLGEEPEEAMETIDRLCALGVLPTVRPVRLTVSAQQQVQKVLGKVPDRPGQMELLTLLKAQKRALQRHDLIRAAGGSSSMCPTCGGCGLEPLLDLHDP